MRLKVLLAVLLSICAIPTFAQFKASLQGTLMDSRGGAIVGAKVTITNQDTGVVRETMTNDQGFYRVTELPPGNYTVAVEAPGFKQSISRDISVEAEQPRGFDVSLQVGAVTETVNVTAGQEILQTQDASLASTVTSEQIVRLPQYGRTLTNSCAWPQASSATARGRRMAPPQTFLTEAARAARTIPSLRWKIRCK